MRNYKRKAGRPQWLKRNPETGKVTRKYRYIKSVDTEGHITRMLSSRRSPGVVIRPERLLNRDWPDVLTVYAAAKILGLDLRGLDRRLEGSGIVRVIDGAQCVERDDLFNFLHNARMISEATWRVIQS